MLYNKHGMWSWTNSLSHIKLYACLHSSMKTVSNIQDISTNCSKNQINKFLSTYYMNNILFSAVAYISNIQWLIVIAWASAANGTYLASNKSNSLACFTSAFFCLENSRKSWSIKRLVLLEALCHSFKIYLFS